MISHLRGIVSSVSDGYVVLDVSGVGYQVFVPGATVGKLPPEGHEATLFTHMAVRQDAVTLYGFASQTERRLFGHLICVSGVGPRMALSVLSVLAPDDIVSSLLNQDVASLTRVPGVGSKTAQRIILDLRDRIGVTKGREPTPRGAFRAAGDSTFEHSVEALMALGYSRSESVEAVERCISELDETANVEVVIRNALKILSKI